MFSGLFCIVTKIFTDRLEYIQDKTVPIWYNMSYKTNTTREMQMSKERKHYTKEEWLAEGERLFGKDFTKYKFRCPKCGNVASGQEFKDAGAKPNDIYCNCIGRFVKGKGCDWAAYGLFDICKCDVDGLPVFEYAE